VLGTFASIRPHIRWPNPIGAGPDVAGYEKNGRISAGPGTGNDIRCNAINKYSASRVLDGTLHTALTVTVV